MSKDGKSLAAASQDETVSVWDYDSGKQIVNSISHSDSIFNLRFSNTESNFLFTAGQDGLIRKWTIMADTSKSFTTSRQILAAEFLTDEELCCVCDGEICLYRVSEGGTRTGIRNGVKSNQVGFPPQRI